MTSDQIPELNLPARVQREGGAIVEVLQYEQHLSLTPSQQREIGMIIARHPELNTEVSVDMLADLTGFHGESISRFIDTLIVDHGLEKVHLAIDCLYECAHRSGASGEHSLSHEHRQLRYALRLLVVMEEAGRPVHDAERFNDCLEALGSLTAVDRLSDEEILAAIEHHDEGGDDPKDIVQDRERNADDYVPDRVSAPLAEKDWGGQSW